MSRALTFPTPSFPEAEVAVGEAEHGLGLGHVVAEAADRGCLHTPSIK